MEPWWTTVTDDRLGELDIETVYTHRVPWKYAEETASSKLSTALENSKTAGICSLALRKAKRFEEKPPETKTLGSYSATGSDLGSSEHSCGLVIKTDAETFLMKSSRQ